MIESIAVILALVFLVIAIIAISKMYDAQRERDFMKKALDDLDEDWDEVQRIIESHNLSPENKVYQIWELL